MEEEKRSVDRQKGVIAALDMKNRGLYASIAFSVYSLLGTKRCLFVRSNLIACLIRQESIYLLFLYLLPDFAITSHGRRTQESLTPHL